MIKRFYTDLISKSVLSTAFLLLLATIFFSSCKVYKPAYYFKDIKKDTVITGFVNTDLELKIQKNDILSISISSLSTEEDGLFNKGVAGAAGGGGYQVTADGFIYLHKLGKQGVVGLTRKELKARLEISLLPYLKDPIVTVNFINHRITVLGETSTIIEMPDEKIPLLDVMAKGGGNISNAELNKIMIIRESGNTKQVKHLNLHDPSIFTSPWYYLQPNDIVVIKPNEEKLDTEQKRSRNQLLYATVISGITFIFLILDRVFR